MKKIRIGAFGAFRGLVLMQSLTVLPEAELVAVCDMNQEALERVKKLADVHGLKIALYTDFEEFYEHDMDAVVLANYATEHAPYAVRFLKSGRHVMSEVPTCETMAQAVELVETVEHTNKVFTLAENYCYMDDTFEMCRLYRRGDIGEIAYGEGAYIHDWSAQHPLKTAGDPNHWRNRVYSTFYCTHAINPLLFITGRRPVQVTGFETATCGVAPTSLGYRGGGTGIQMITLDNGAILRCINGGLKREPFENNLNYIIYGTKGCLETHTVYDHNISVYREGDAFCKGTTESYYPKRFIAPKAAKEFLDSAVKLPEIFSSGTLNTQFHRCGDFYPGYFFIQKILDREEGEYAVDVYNAVMTSMCGILAYHSILNGNVPMDIPDLHDPAQRDVFRNDNACTTPEVAGDQLIPARPGGEPDINSEVYEYVHSLWAAGKPAEHGYQPES